MCACEKVGECRSERCQVSSRLRIRAEPMATLAFEDAQEPNPQIMKDFWWRVACPQATLRFRIFSIGFNQPVTAVVSAVNKTDLPRVFGAEHIEAMVDVI